MIAARLELLRGADELATRAAQLREQCAAGEAAPWPEYLDTLRTLAAVVSAPATGDARDTLTTRELGQRLGVTARTIRRRHAKGQIAPARPGGRGRAALWPAEAAR